MGTGLVTVSNGMLTSPALPLLLQLQAAGVRFKVDADVVLVSPRGVLTPEQREVFRAHQAAVRVLVAIVTDVGVQDRAAEFRRQLAQTPAPRVPAFLFRTGISYRAGVCFSCADPLLALRFGRCWRCALAWRLAAGVPVDAVLAEAIDTARLA